MTLRIIRIMLVVAVLLAAVFAHIEADAIDSPESGITTRDGCGENKGLSRNNCNRGFVTYPEENCLYSSGNRDDVGIPSGERSDDIDVPSWQIGDWWTYYLTIYSNLGGGNYFALWSNVTYTVSEISHYDKNGTSYLAYNLSTTGDVVGKGHLDGTDHFFDGKGEGAPDLEEKGSVNGYKVLRVSDLSQLYERTKYNGHLHIQFGPFWLAPDASFEFILWDTTPVEDVDFPALDGDVFWYDTTRRTILNIDIPDQPDYSEHYDNISPNNYTVNGTADVGKTVMAGTFDTYYLEADSHTGNESISRWYSPDAGNFAKEILATQGATGVMKSDRELKEYNVSGEPNNIDLLPVVNLPGLTTRVTGEFPERPNRNVQVETPFNGGNWAAVTDDNGRFAVDITAPSAWDSTNTTTDVGSFGVCAFVEGLPSNTIAARTLTLVAEDHSPPTAHAGNSITVDEDVPYRFNGSTSSDDFAIANYTWTLELPSGPERIYGREPFYTFELPGNYAVTLNVTDIGGNFDTDSILVDVLDKTPPVAIMSPADNTTVDAGILLYLDSSASFDPEGGTIVNHTWEIVRPGGAVQTKFGDNVSYTFPTGGIYDVTLILLDASGNQGVGGLNVTVRDITPPVCEAGNPIIIDQHQYAHFNGSASSDDVEILNFTWSFAYNGSSVTLYGAGVSFLLHDAGEYDVTLSVVDWGENTAEDHLTVTVRDITQPVADAGEDQWVGTGKETFMSGLASTDNVGIEHYNWSFTYNGSKVWMEGSNVSFIFDLPGDYHITLNVSDVAGNTDESVVLVSVRDSTQPVARAGDDIYTGAGVAVAFNGSDSSDNVGVVNYTWNFTYKGNNVELYGPAPEFVFDDLGIYIVTMEVRDAARNSATASVQVMVRDIKKPVASAGDYVEITLGENVTLDGSGSGDDLGIINFTWTIVGPSGREIYYGPKVSFTPTVPGKFNVTLKVTDAGGNLDIDHMEITVKDRNGDPSDRDRVEGIGLGRGPVVMVIIIIVAIGVVLVGLFLLIARKVMKRDDETDAEDRKGCEDRGGNVRGRGDVLILVDLEEKREDLLRKRDRLHGKLEQLDWDLEDSYIDEQEYDRLVARYDRKLERTDRELDEVEDEIEQIERKVNRRRRRGGSGEREGRMYGGRGSEDFQDIEYDDEWDESDVDEDWMDDEWDDGEWD